MNLSSSGGFRARSKKGDQRPEKQQQQQPKQQRNNRRAPRSEERRDGLSLAGVDKDRAAAVATLTAVYEQDAYANLVLPKLLRERKITGRDAAFATEIAYGALRNQGIIDAVISDVSDRELRSIAPSVLVALRLGIYQLLFTRVEAHAAVDTTVRIVEGLGQDKAKGFANGIMRTVSRNQPAEWIDKLAPADSLASLAFKSSHPEWIARSFAEQLSAEELQEALAADSERPKVHLVARPGEISAEELALIAGGEEAAYSPYGVYLEGGDPAQLDPVREGLAGVQDEGSQIIARALAHASVEGPDNGRWLDLCAGPGGKAALIGGLARVDGAKVDAVEVAEHRARLVEQATRDLPVTVHVADGRSPQLETGYDRVLVDAPCSGLGALRRRPEARWRKSESDIQGLTELQFELLESAARLTRDGGVIVYSTCSPDLRETRQIVDKAVKELGLVELNAQELTCGMPKLGEYPSAQMWPHRHGTDAMFFAVLRKPIPTPAEV